MNPPYMGSGRFDDVLSKYVKDNYADAKADLFSVFMQMGMERLAPNGKMAQINMQNWMFLSSFEKLRKQFLTHYNIDNMLHLGPRTFDELSGEVVQNTAFVLSKHKPVEQGGVYYRLVEGNNCADKERLFLEAKQGDGKAIINSKSYTVNYPNVEQKNFEKIPGCPIGYWVSEKEQKQFIQGLLNKYAKPCKGIDTGENAYFLKLWFEVSSNEIDDSLGQGKWVPYNKGGGFRRWYGFREYVLKWNGSEEELASRLSWITKKPTLRNKNYWFKESFTWSSISSDGFSARFSPKGALFDNGGSSVFSENNLYLIGGLINSKVANRYFEFLAPTLNFQPGDVGHIAYSEKLKDVVVQDRISAIVSENISISKSDWDAHETSWDFQRNELLSVDEQTYMDNFNNFVEDHYKETGERLCIDPAAPQFNSLAWRIEQYKQKWEHKFKQLHENEEELNRKFIDIYGLQDELTPDVPLNEITILQQGEISIE